MTATTTETMIDSGAIAEVDGMTRSSFLLRGALAAGAVYGTAMVGPFVSQALAADDSSDMDILNFALTLEFLEADFYKKGMALKLDAGAMKFAKLAGSQEQQHVDAIIATIKKLGGTPIASPSFKFPMTDQASFLKIAVALEDTGVSAYNGAGPLLKDKTLLGAAGSIVQVEARHAAQARLLAGQDPAPDAFDKALQKDAVLAAAGPFIVK